MLSEWKRKTQSFCEELMISCQQGSIKHLLYVVFVGGAIYFVFIAIMTFILWKPIENFVSSKAGLSSLHWAARYGDIEKVKKLARGGADINCMGKNGDTPLHYAAMNGHRETVEVLLELGADIDQKSHRGYTALHFSVSRGRPDIVSLLLSKGADTFIKDYDGRIPIELAHEMLNRDPPWLFKGDMEELKEKIKTCEELLAKHVAAQRVENINGGRN